MLVFENPRKYPQIRVIVWKKKYFLVNIHINADLNTSN